MKTYSEPRLQSFHIAGVSHISPTDAFEALNAGQADLVDVREEIEITLASIDFEPLYIHPMSSILDSFHQLSNDRPLIILCAHGERSTKVANLLRLQGYLSVANLDGGVEAWKKADLPMKGCGPEKCSACSCGCGE